MEMCKEMKAVNVTAMVGEYAGFKMSVSFDSFNQKFVMNLKGQLSHNLEIGADPLGNISRINHAIESMPRQLAELQTKLENVERQLETAKTEVTKPFAQEEELAQKLERLAALNALLNMDEKGDEALGMDDEPGEESESRETSGQAVQKSGQEESVPETEKKSNAVTMPYSGKAAGQGIAAGSGGFPTRKIAAAMADQPVQRMSLREKLEAFKMQAAGAGRTDMEKAKGKEETL